MTRAIGETMQHVFVLDTNHIPQTPMHPAVARKLLSTEQAAVFRRYPFTIILKTAGPVHPQGVLGDVPPARGCRLKIDPGSKTSGLAILQGDRVIWAAELTHRGQRIKAALERRRAIRRSRRQRKTRYRQPRFLHRQRPDGWLPPSLWSRVCNIMTWVERLMQYCPIHALSQELVRFDTQIMQSPEISGVEYQQGELAGYEVREYLLEKWGRTCAYCGKTDVPLEVEHIVPRTRGGSHRVSNLTLACTSCNQHKGKQTAEEFGFPQIQGKAKQPLRDAAAAGATRWALYRQLCTTGLPVECGTGGRTKYNRTRLGLPKAHWTDAACVGASTPETLRATGIQPLGIRAMGHGTRQRCRTDTYGSPSRIVPGRSAFLVCRQATWSKPAYRAGSIKARGSAVWWSKPAAGLILSSVTRKPACIRSIARGYGLLMAIRTPCLLSQAPLFPPSTKVQGLHSGFL